MFDRLSSPLHLLARSWDVLVIGSGYGGAVAASRLARAGLRVGLLERGAERPPSAMPRGGSEVAAASTVRSPLGRFGPGDGLYRYDMGDRVVGQGVGLGGGSLVNSAVFRRPDSRVFEDPIWPRELREDREGLEEGYRRFADALGSRPHPRVDELPRSAFYRKMAGDRPLERLSLGIAFQGGDNAQGVYQPACHDCGECNTGCPTGAKSSLDRNLLPDAVAHGALVFSNMNVRHVLPAQQGQRRWLVTVEPTAVGAERFGGMPLELEADVVVVAAGTVGSTGLLQRSRAAGLPVSAMLGRRFSGNGSYLAFVDGLDAETGMQGQLRRRHAGGRTGPGITQAILVQGDGLDEDVLIEDGANPSFADVVWGRVVAGLGREGAERVAALARAREADARRTVNLLCMAHDGSLGVLEEHSGDDPFVRWPDGIRDGTRAHIDRQLGELAESLGGRYAPLGDTVTVHPLGGCAMGEDAVGGVVDHRGAVFAGPEGKAVHEGLYVADASIVPRSLGCNPAWTIAALAERAAVHIAAELGRSFDADAPCPGRPPPAVLGRSVRFTERMQGWISLDEGHDCSVGATMARARGEASGFTVSIAYPDVEALRRDRSTPAAVVGTARIAALSANPLTILGGEFRLFVERGDRVEQAEMVYRLPLHGAGIPGLRLEGRKELRPGGPRAGLRQTTTLLARLVSDEGPIGCGTLEISWIDLLRQATTFGGSVAEVARFFGVFAGTVRQNWFGPASSRRAEDLDRPRTLHRPLRAPGVERHAVTTADGVRLQLLRHRGGDRGPVLLVGGYAMTELVFTLDTVDTNLVEALCERGYDVWILLWRSSPALPASRTSFTLDDVAAHDHAAALDFVREATGADRVHVVAHCLGAVTLVMGLLTGAVTGVGSAVLMQAAAHLEMPPVAQLKMASRLPSILDRLGVQGLPAGASASDPLPLRLADLAMRAWPQLAGGACRSASCRRCSFMYGDLIEHDNVSEATHALLPRLVGHSAVRPFRQLARMGRAGHVVDRRGRDVYLPGLAKLDLPLTMLWGDRSGVFGAGATRRTYEALVGLHGPERLRHVVLPGYGHLDSLIGRSAAADAFPHILEHLERWGEPVEA